MATKLEISHKQELTKKIDDKNVIKIDNNQDIINLFDDLDNSQDTEEEKLHGYFASLVSKHKSDVIIDNAAKKMLEKDMTQKNGWIEVDDDINIHIDPSLIAVFYSRAIHYKKKLLISEQLKIEEKRQKKELLAKSEYKKEWSEELNEAGKNKLKEELDASEKKLNEAYNVSIDLKNAVVPTTANATEESEKWRRGNMLDSLGSGKINDFWKYALSWLSAVSWVFGIAAAVTWNKWLKKKITELKIKAYETVAENSEIDVTDSLASAKVKLSEIEKEIALAAITTTTPENTTTKTKTSTDQEVATTQGTQVW